MAIKKASGFRSDPMGAECGNSAVVILGHHFSAADKDGDVLRLGVMGFEVTYHRITLSSDVGTGVTIDLGVQKLESGVTVPDFFKAGVDVSAAGRKELDCAPFFLSDRKGDEMHEIIATVHGTPTPDSCLFVHLEYIYNGH